MRTGEAALGAGRVTGAAPRKGLLGTEGGGTEVEEGGAVGTEGTVETDGAVGRLETVGDVATDYPGINVGSSGRKGKDLLC